MSIVVSLGVLANAVQGLQAVSAAKLPAAEAFRLAKLTAAVDAELRTLSEQRQKLMDQYLPRAGEGETLSAPSAENAAAFQKEMTELMAVEIEIPHPPIKLSQLEGKEFSSAEMTSLGPFLVDDTENAD